MRVSKDEAGWESGGSNRARFKPPARQFDARFPTIIVNRRFILNLPLTRSSQTAFICGCVGVGGADE
jgi:hypothetical protein